jgi:O-Antigen ligase
VTQESPTVAARGGPSAYPRLFLSRLQAVAGDGKRLAVAAGLVALVLVVLGIVAARLLGDDFPTVVFVAALVVAGVGVFRPYVAVLGAIFVSPTFGWATFGPDISPFQVLVAGAAAGCLLELRPAVLRRLLTRPEVVLAILFFGALVLAATVRHGSSDWAFVRNYFGAVVFFGTCAVTLRTVQRRRYAVGALVAGCTATAAVGLVQLFTTDALVSGWVLPHVGLVQDTYSRLGSPWGLASVGSDYGKDVLIGFLVLVPLLFHAEGRRWLPVVACVVLAVGLAMSGSRSAWLAATVGLLYIAATSRRLELAVPLVVLAGFFVFLIARPATPVDLQAAAGLSRQGNRPSGEADRDPSSGFQSPRLVIGGTRDRVSTDLSNDLRRRLTRAGLEMVRDQPVFGVGAGAFKNYVDAYEPIEKTDRVVDARRNLPAHNVLLEIWAGSGTPALLLYLAFVGAVLLRLHRSRADHRQPGLAVGLTAALIGVLVASLFHNYQYDNLIWALYGLAASIAVWDGRALRAPA